MRPGDMTPLSISYLLDLIVVKTSQQIRLQGEMLANPYGRNGWFIEQRSQRFSTWDLFFFSVRHTSRDDLKRRVTHKEKWLAKKNLKKNTTRRKSRVKKYL